MSQHPSARLCSASPNSTVGGVQGPHPCTSTPPLPAVRSTLVPAPVPWLGLHWGSDALPVLPISRVLLTPPALGEPYSLEGHIPILLAHTRGCKHAGLGPAALVLSHVWLCGVLTAVALPFISLQKPRASTWGKGQGLMLRDWAGSTPLSASLPFAHPLNLRKDTGCTRVSISRAPGLSCTRSPCHPAAAPQAGSIAPCCGRGRRPSRRRAHQASKVAEPSFRPRTSRLRPQV